ncbi:STAS domain-containing protein [Actinomadura sp. ATCC 31491]|uniref:Anti-sigma factor antagonist n=1 Tax=Actinomadura luzonensis TaxID=2805427 RepID=A0ABT0G7T4_9ACTN|nr:STAS domain-containing protein [Actinomadura luzonensis]MCK2220660.1 STAS domain-containing protein [Actinomadura luzonensis]
MTCKMKMDVEGETATIRLAGELDGRSAPQLNDLVTQAVGRQVDKLVLLLDELTYMSSAGVRCLLFAHQKLPRGSEITLVGTTPEVAETIRLTGFDRSIVMQ